jgi:hypothetical protein
LQTSPQDPQFFGSLFSLTQSPLHGLYWPVQLTPHFVPSQLAVPLPLGGPAQGEHELVPQLDVDVLLEQVPVQSCVPPGHTHEPPPSHSEPPVHALLQVPQWLLSVFSFTQVVPQTLSPAVLQEGTQLVPLQVADPPVGAPAAQIAHEGPQALSSFATHAPLQTWFGDAHWHEPPTQCSPLGHCLLQPLQLLSSVVRSTQALPQGLNPFAQLVPHLPLEQVATVCSPVAVHPCPHMPQLPVFVDVSTHEPLHSIGAVEGHPEAHA